MDIFEIKEITKHVDADDLVSAVVCFHHQEPFGSDEVGQSVEVEVRISARDDVTLAQLHEALFEKAVVELRHTLALCEGKTAKLLLAKTAREAAERAEALGKWDNEP